LHNTSSPTGGIQDDWQFPHEPFDAQTVTMFPQELPTSNRRQELISGTLIHMQKRTHQITTWQAHCSWWHFAAEQVVQNEEHPAAEKQKSRSTSILSFSGEMGKI